jgi:hypothetical protein
MAGMNVGDLLARGKMFPGGEIRTRDEAGGRLSAAVHGEEKKASGASAQDRPARS